MIAFVPSNGFLWAWALFLLLVAVVIVPIVAILLLRLVMAGFALNKHARIADIAARPVRVNTAPVPELARTLALIKEVTNVARSAERHGAELERVLGREIMVRR